MLEFQFVAFGWEFPYWLAVGVGGVIVSFFVYLLGSSLTDLTSAFVVGYKRGRATHDHNVELQSARDRAETGNASIPLLEIPSSAVISILSTEDPPENWVDHRWLQSPRQPIMWAKIDNNTPDARTTLYTFGRNYNRSMGYDISERIREDSPLQWVGGTHMHTSNSDGTVCGLSMHTMGDTLVSTRYYHVPGIEEFVSDLDHAERIESIEDIAGRDSYRWLKSLSSWQQNHILDMVGLGSNGENKGHNVQDTDKHAASTLTKKRNVKLD